LPSCALLTRARRPAPPPFTPFLPTSIGTAEVESALVAHPKCAEAAVVGYEHPIKGQGIYAYVTLMEVGCGASGVAGFGAGSRLDWAGQSSPCLPSNTLHPSTPTPKPPNPSFPGRALH
jgi:hypothetical protein